MQLSGSEAASLRQEGLLSLARLERRLRNETASIVEELLAGWRELGGR